MITHVSTDTHSDATSDAVSTLVAVRPYAGPRASSAPTGPTSRPEPYRPASARAFVQATASSDDLPWIDQFLSNTPVQAVAVVAHEPTDAVSDVAPERTATIVEDVWVTPLMAAHAEPVADAPVNESWPLEEASAQLAEMLPSLQRAESDTDTPARLFAERHAEEPLPAWSDDDMIDIMPLGTVAQQTAAQQGVTQSVTHRESSSTASPHGEAAARSLELVAQRVRSGELTLPGYDPALGDSAALIAALAALHGVR